MGTKKAKGMTTFSETRGGRCRGNNHSVSSSLLWWFWVSLKWLKWTVVKRGRTQTQPGSPYTRTHTHLQLVTHTHTHMQLVTHTHTRILRRSSCGDKGTWWGGLAKSGTQIHRCQPPTPIGQLLGSWCGAIPGCGGPCCLVGRSADDVTKGVLMDRVVYILYVFGFI